MDTDVQNGDLSNSPLTHPDLESQSMHSKDQLCEFCSKVDFKSLLMTCDDLRTPEGLVGKRFCSLADVQTVLASSNCPVCRLVSSCIRFHPDEVRALAAVMLQSQPHDVRRRHTESHRRNRETWPWRIEVNVCECHLHEGGGAHIYQVGSLLPVKEEEPEKRSPNEEHFGVCESNEPIFARQILPSVDIELLKSWITFCDQTHDVCKRKEPLTGDEPYIRLIDVTEKRLVTASLHENYVALSYVWGKDVVGLVTKATEPKLRQKGSLDKEVVSNIVSDAMDLVAKLGIQYIWIDTACIIQDDVADKQRQLPIMDLIYSQANLVIIADVENANARLPRWKADLDRDKPPLEKISGILFTTGQINLNNVMMKSLWNTRGWTLQESLLGKRKLIFTKTQVHWECCEEGWGEDRVLEFSTYCHLPTNESCVIKRFTMGRSGSLCAFPIELCAMAEYAYRATAFAHREFTNGNDTFWAFIGILRSIKHYFPKGYIWGLPYDNLDAALLWRTTSDADRHCCHTIRHEDGTLRRYPIPSWCWISKSRSISYAVCGGALQSLVQWHEPLRYPNDYRWMYCPEHSIAQSPCFTAGIAPWEKSSSELFDYGLLRFTAQATTLRVKVIEHPIVKPMVQNTETEPSSGSQFDPRSVIPAHIQLDSGKIISEMPVPRSLFASELEISCEFILLSKDHEVERTGADQTSHSRDNGPHTPKIRCSPNLNIMLIMWCSNCMGARYAERVAVEKICESAWKEAGATEKDIILG